VKKPVLPPTDVVGPHVASSKEKAILAIHHPASPPSAVALLRRTGGRGILAFSRKEGARCRAQGKTHDEKNEGGKTR
jgi:hypothetical protein